MALEPASSNVDDVAARLRTGSPSIFGRIQNGQLLLDLRTVHPRYDVSLVEAVLAVPGEEARKENRTEQFGEAGAEEIDG